MSDLGRKLRFGVVVGGVQALAVVAVNLVWRFTRDSWGHGAWALYLGGLLIVVPLVGLRLAQSWAGVRLTTARQATVFASVAAINAIQIFAAEGFEEAGVALRLVVVVYGVVVTTVATFFSGRADPPDIVSQRARRSTAKTAHQR